MYDRDFAIGIRKRALAAFRERLKRSLLKNIASLTPDTIINGKTHFDGVTAEMRD